MMVTDTIITLGSFTCPTVAVGDTCVLVGNYVIQQLDVNVERIINVAQGVSDKTISDPETDTKNVTAGPPLSEPVLVSTRDQWAEDSAVSTDFNVGW